MFSARTNWNNSPNALSILLSGKRADGEAILDLTESNPTTCGFTYPREIILRALSHESVLRYDPHAAGAAQAREAVSSFSAAHGVSISPDRTFLTASTSEGYSFLFKLLCDAGDEIVVPKPGYPLFEYLCPLNDVAARPYRLGYDGEWHVDFTSLEEVVTGRTRAIVLVHPNNPTGSFLKQEEFDRIERFARDRKCAIITDEVFGSFGFDLPGASGRATDFHAPMLHFSLNGISKLLGLPQLKLSWITVSGESGLVRSALERLEIIGDTFLSVNTPSQAALPILLQHAAPVHDQILSRVRSNYEHLQAVCAGSRISVLRTEGGWNGILRMPGSRTDEEWAEDLLRDYNILVQPGHYFDLEEDSHIVVSLLSQVDLFERGIRGLCRAAG